MKSYGSYETKDDKYYNNNNRKSSIQTSEAQNNHSRSYPISYLAIFGLILLSITIYYTNKINLQLINNDTNTIITSSTTQQKPNIIIMMIDDLSWSTLFNNNSKQLKYAPNIQSLKNNGISIPNYYSHEMCSPSRAAFLTGKYANTLGMQYHLPALNSGWGLPLQHLTIADVLKQNSYITHLLGKWHLGYGLPQYLPTSRGFDTFIGYLTGVIYHFTKRTELVTTIKDFMIMNSTCYIGYDNSDMNTYSSILYLNKSLNIIANHNKEYPLLLDINFQGVHSPFTDTDHNDGLNDNDEFINRDIYYDIMSTLQVCMHVIIAYVLLLTLVTYCLLSPSI
jgi:hypothetical protein